MSELPKKSVDELVDLRVKALQLEEFKRLEEPDVRELVIQKHDIFKQKKELDKQLNKVTKKLIELLEVNLPDELKNI